MSEAESATSDRAPSRQIVAELKVSGHLMNLEPGLFCIVQAPSANGDPSRGLPGVRISLPPGSMQHSDAVMIKSFRDDGWLHSQGDAALVRVNGAPAQVLVTVYQAQGVPDSAPNLQVLRLIDPAAVAAPAAGARPAAAAKPEVMDVVAHIQGRGDVGSRIGQWIGEAGSKRWIEGFAMAPLEGIEAADVEYQAVLGRGWLSPWVEGGQFCGSRGMALPLLGIRVRLRGEAAAKFDCSYAASFVDGAKIGPVENGEPCETENLAAMEAFQVVIRPKGAAAEPEPLPARTSAKATVPGAKSSPATVAKAPAPTRTRAAPPPPPAPAAKAAKPPAGRAKAR